MSASPGSSELSDSDLSAIAHSLRNLQSPLSLVQHLFYDDTELIRRLTNTDRCVKDSRETVLKILHEWRRKNHGSGANMKLIAALQDVDKKAANKLMPLLIPKGKPILNVHYHAVFKRVAGAEHFCIFVSSKLFGSELTASELQRKDQLSALFKRVFRFEVALVYFSQLPFTENVPCFAVLNITLHGILTSLSAVESEHLQRVLVLELEDIVDERSCNSIHIHTAMSLGTTIQFIMSIPHLKASALLKCWLRGDERSSLQRRLALLSFLNCPEPIITITNHLDGNHWKITRNTIFSQSLTERDPYQKEDNARTCHAAEQDEAGCAEPVEHSLTEETHAQKILAKRLQDPDVLRAIADSVTSPFECNKLAIELGVNFHHFAREPVNRLALKVLKEWVNTKGDYASGRHLHSALTKIGRRDLADHFQGRLVHKDLPDRPPGETAKLTQSSEEQMGIAETTFLNPQLHSLAPLVEQMVLKLETFQPWRWSEIRVANCSTDTELNNQAYMFEEDSKHVIKLLDLFCRKSENRLGEERKNITADVARLSLSHNTIARDVPRHIAIVGSSGAGKSVACQLLCSNVSAGVLKERLSRVLCWDFRDVQVRKATGITELLQIATQCSDATTCRPLAEELLASRGKGVLLIFDGLEQFSAADSVIWSLINGYLLSLSHVVVTTRPCGIVKRLTNFVFYQLQLDEVLENRLGKQLPFELKPALASLMRLPPIALAACEVFREYPSYEPNTLTELISSTVTVALHQFTSDGGACTVSKMFDHAHPVGVDGLHERARTFLLNLAAIAHETFENCQFAFNDASLRTHMTADMDLDHLALLNKKKSTPEGDIYWFQHSAFQEFLAAVHFVQTLKEKNSAEAAARCIKIATTDIGTGRCKGFFWRFVSGLVDRSLRRVLFDSLISSLLVSGKDECMDRSSDFRLLLQCATEMGDGNDLAAASKCGLIKRITLQRVTVVDIELLSSARFVTQSLRCIQLTFERREGCSITPKRQTQLQRWMSAVMEMLKACSSLTRLVIVGPNCQLLDRKGFSFLCDIVKAGKLEWLWLSWSQLGDSGASKLAGALRECTHLEYLDLQGNAIGNDGAISLAESLVHSRTLQQLFLTHNRYNELTRWRLARLYNIRDRLI